MSVGGFGTGAGVEESGVCRWSDSRDADEGGEGSGTGRHDALGLIFSAFWKLVFKSELGGPADRDFIIYAFQDQIGLIPDFRSTRVM